MYNDFSDKNVNNTAKERECFKNKLILIIMQNISFRKSNITGLPLLQTA